MEIKLKFKLLLGVKVGWNVFKQLIPFGAILLAIAFATSLIGSMVLDGFLEQVFLVVTGTCYTMILLIQIKNIHETLNHTHKEVIVEASKTFLPALITASVLWLIDFLFSFIIGFLLPLDVLQYALDVFLAVAFLYINHCIAIGKDSPFEGINNAMMAYSKNAPKVWMLGLFIIGWKVITVLPAISDNNILSTLTFFVVGPLLTAVLLCITTSHYFQMIRKENQGAYQYK